MGRFSFTRGDRLVRKSDFEEIKATGRKAQTPHFIIVTRRSPTGRTRLGISASTRIGHAPQRNRVKRVLREFFRLHRETLPVATDIHIIARKGAPDLGYRQVCEEIGPHLLAKKP